MGTTDDNSIHFKKQGVTVTCLMISLGIVVCCLIVGATHYIKQVRINGVALVDEGLVQDIAATYVTDETLTFLQVIYKKEKRHVNREAVYYEILSADGSHLKRVPPTTINETEDKVWIETTFFLNEVLKHQFDYISMHYTIDNRAYDIQLPVFDATLLTEKEADVNPKIYQTQEEVFTWMKQYTSISPLQDYQFFAESLHLKLDNSQPLTHYRLIKDGHVTIDSEYKQESNNGIDLKSIIPGDYAIQLNGTYVSSEDNIDMKWYGIARQGEIKCYNLMNQQGLLMLKVEVLEEGPAHDYDLLIDPGHGGLDGGAEGLGLIEATETLKISAYLQKRFEDHGLKVKLTRDGNYEPSGDETFVYEESPYYESGRVEQAYQYQANYIISNHLNAYNGYASGYEIYSSITTTNEWAELISNQNIEINRLPHDAMTNGSFVSTGTYKQSFECDATDPCDGIRDYLYMIRETGGDLTQPYKLPAINEPYKNLPKHGAESILIEYAYLDNSRDKNRWLTEWETYGEAVVKATLTYLEINYQPNEASNGE